ncbi:MAG: biotin/lipoyl-binding protein [Chordicoccus sp.]
MKRKKVIAVIVTAALMTGSVFGIGVAVRKTTSGNSAVTVIQGSSINAGYWGNDTQSMNGTVSSSATQNVYLSSGDTVQSVNVKAGDTVKAGDVLLKYDPAKAQLAFKGEQISYDEIQLKIKVAQQNLNTLSKIKPIADSTPDSGDGTDIDNGGDDGGYDGGDNGDIDDNGYDDGGDNGGDIDNGGDDNGGNTDSNTDSDTDSGKTDSDTDSGKTDSDTDSNNTKNDYSKALKTISSLTDAYNAQPGDKDKDTLGTKENPYRFLINDNTVIRMSFLKELAAKNGSKGTESGNTSSESSAESSESTSSGSQSDGSKASSGASSGSTSSDSSGKKADSSSDQTSSGTSSGQTDSGKNHCYVVFEVREGDSVSGKLTSAWRIDAADIETVSTDSTSDTSSDKTGSDATSSGSTTDSKPTGSDASSGKTDSGSSTSGKAGSEGSTSGKTGSEGSTSGKSSGSESAGSGSSGSTSSGAQSGTEAGVESAEGTTGTSSESSLESLPASLVLLRSGAVKLMSTAADTSDGSADASGSSDDSSSLSAIGVIPSDAQYTKADLAQAIQDQKDTLRDEQLNLKEEDIKLRAAQKAVEAGTVVAKMDGVVKSVGDLSNPPKDGSAFITVTGGSGTYIKSAVSETYLDSLHEGDTVTVMSWNSGTTATAVVKDISTYPDTTGQYAQTDANVSYYPFTAVVEGDANFSADDYLNVTLDSVGVADSNGFYLMKAFVRTDDSGQKYVYKEGSDGKLKKQVIKVGKVTSDGYEVKSGVTEDDWLAFPYGKNVKDGAKVKEGSIEDLYNS